jgi:hypothetical protein
MGNAPALPLPVRLVAVFGHPEDSELFQGYFRTVHIPLTLKMPNYLSIR